MSLLIIGYQYSRISTLESNIESKDEALLALREKVSQLSSALGDTNQEIADQIKQINTILDGLDLPEEKPKSHEYENSGDIFTRMSSWFSADSEVDTQPGESSS